MRDSVPANADARGAEEAVQVMARVSAKGVGQDRHEKVADFGCTVGVCRIHGTGRMSM